MKKEFYMLRALLLAKKGIGNVSPNPLVGCVIVKNNQIIGEGYHQAFGKAHAEINALLQAGTKAKGAEMFVTLEPCCHHGKTPPCTKAILNAEIKKVYIAMQDPNPLVSGKGIEFLEKNKIEVVVGLEKEKAIKINETFIHFIQNKTPFVSLKIATTLDGKITRQDGIKQITNLKSQQFVHKLRKESDAILIGKNTVIQDNPQLTPYLLTKAKSPLRIILDTNLSLNSNYKVFDNSNFIIVCKQDLPQNKKEKYLKKGGKILAMKNDQIDLKLFLKELGKMGISSLLVEGGSEIFTSFLNQNLAQKLYWIKAPLINGQDGLNSIKDLKQITKIKNTQIKKMKDNFLIEGYFENNC